VTAGDRARRQDAIRTVFEDDYLLVVNKPPGLLSVGADSVEERLRRAPHHAGVACVHRLDRDTSGCLLLAKRADAQEAAIALFRTRRISKQYHAIVTGQLRVESRRIRKPVAGRDAVTMIRTLDASQEASHLLARIETGRTHQIRKHLASLGHPVLGDRRYATAAPVTDRSLSVPRQMLHASRLRFSHPVTGAALRVDAALPRDFRECLRTYRLS
jgi:23S rRNA pseudouridine1911/1915/1917 synthase